MDIQDVKVVSLQLTQRARQGDMEGFRAIAGEIGLDDIIITFVMVEACSILWCNDHLIAEAGAGLQPFANPLLGLLVLIIVGGINEDAALRVKVVEELEHGVFAHYTHKALPWGC